MVMLYFRPVDPCDLRCAIMRMRVCKMYYAGARIGNYCIFVMQCLGALPWSCYILDLSIPKILRFAMRVCICKMMLIG